MKLIVGLGNPGEKYSNTRHNAGFRVLDHLAQALELGQWKLMSKCSALTLKTTIAGEQVLLAKPQTFMNLSGAAVLALQQFYDIAVTDMLIIYDDKDLPVGTIRYKTKGSSGGQNGMKNIIAVLGTPEISRLKIGVAPIDPEQPLGDTAKYVLGRFSSEQQELLPEVMQQSVEKMNDWLSNS